MSVLPAVIAAVLCQACLLRSAADSCCTLYDTVSDSRPGLSLAEEQVRGCT